MLVAGIPLWLWARRAYPDYFRRRAEAAEYLTEMLPDEFRVTDEATEIEEFPAPAVPRTVDPASPDERRET